MNPRQKFPSSDIDNTRRHDHHHNHHQQHQFLESSISLDDDDDDDDDEDPLLKEFQESTFPSSSKGGSHASAACNSGGEDDVVEPFDVACHVLFFENKQCREKEKDTSLIPVVEDDDDRTKDNDPNPNHTLLRWFPPAESSYSSSDNVILEGLDGTGPLHSPSLEEEICSHRNTMMMTLASDKPARLSSSDSRIEVSISSHQSTHHDPQDDAGTRLRDSVVHSVHLDGWNPCAQEQPPQRQRQQQQPYPISALIDRNVGASPLAPSSPSSIHASSVGGSTTTNDDEDDEADYCGDEFLDRDDDIAVFPEELPPTSSEAATLQPLAPADMDSVVAKQMTELSLQEREKVYFDIHGVSDEILETPELLETKLHELHLALQQQQLQLQSNRTAYDLAISLDRSYVESDELRLSFLRADSLDVTKAALRLTRHFQAKLDLFGPELLVKDITQDDLDPDTLDALYCGLAQYLPLRDRAGRLVHLSFYHPDSISLKSKLKRTFYMSMVSAEDPETQRKGRVAVGYLTGQEIPSPPRNDWQVGNVLNALPVRMEAIHLCYDTKTIWSPIFSVFKFVVTLFTRLRIREHYGTNEECLLSLQTFGIPATREIFPLEQVEGTRYCRVSNGEHVRFLRKRRNLERLRKRHAADFTRETLKSLWKETASTPTKTTSTTTPGINNAGVFITTTDEKAKIIGKKNARTPAGGAGYRKQVLMKQGISPAPENSAISPRTAPKSGYLGNPLDSRISFPGRNDVLLGRGKGFYQHTGNIRFRDSIERRSAAYDAARTSSEKNAITAEVIRLVEESGGRFLKDDRHCGWMQVDRETARQKVAHVFRSLRPVASNVNTTSGGVDSSRKSSFVTGEGTGGESTDVMMEHKRLRR